MKKHRKARLLTMDELRARPCEVDGKPALFHRWVEEDRELLHFHPYVQGENIKASIDIFRDTGMTSCGVDIQTARHTYALVEYRDGTIDKVKPEQIRFTGEAHRK